MSCCPPLGLPFQIFGVRWPRLQMLKYITGTKFIIALAVAETSYPKGLARRAIAFCYRKVGRNRLYWRLKPSVLSSVKMRPARRGKQKKTFFQSSFFYS